MALHSSTALSSAARAHDLPALYAALLVTGDSPDDVALKGKTALMLAAQTNGPDAIKIVIALLATGATGCGLNHRDAKGRTALMMAAQCGSACVLQALLEAGADLETVCDRGESAWVKAKKGGQQEASSVLEAGGARSGQLMGIRRVMPRAFSMPTVSGPPLAASRFSCQYRDRMTVCMRGFVGQWPAIRMWSTDRVRLAHVMGGAAPRLPVLCAAVTAAIKGIPGSQGSGVDADSGTPQEGATLSVDEALTDLLDTTALHSFEGVSSVQPLQCKLYPLTAAMVADLGRIPNDLFGAPSVAVAGETRCQLSSRGVHAPLHFDNCHSVVCQIVGRKVFTCFAPRDSRHLYPFSCADGNVRMSRVDLWTWRYGGEGAMLAERGKYPDVAFATPLECTLSPGDTLYIPPGWWHMAESLEGSISVLLPFDMTTEEQRTRDQPWTAVGWGERRLGELQPPSASSATTSDGRDAASPLGSGEGESMAASAHALAAAPLAAAQAAARGMPGSHVARGHAGEACDGPSAVQLASSEPRRPAVPPERVQAAAADGRATVTTHEPAPDDDVHVPMPSWEEVAAFLRRANPGAYGLPIAAAARRAQSSMAQAKALEEAAQGILQMMAAAASKTSMGLLRAGDCPTLYAEDDPRNVWALEGRR